MADGSNLPIILIEVVLVFGGVLLFGWWQLRSVKRDRERTLASKATTATTATTAAAAAATESADSADAPAPASPPPQQPPQQPPPR